MAGSLAPPAGPVASSGRFGPRVEISQATTPGDPVSTFIIDRPGSYFLAGDVVGELNKAAINITASNVHVDLNGFSLIGMAGTRRGVRVAAALEDVHIENGTIKGWGLSGLSNTSDRGVVRNISSSGNAGFGLDIGDFAIVDSCQLSGNGSGGITGGSYCQVSNSVGHGNAGYAMNLGEGSFVESCTAAGTAGGVGADGIVVGDGSIIVHCLARGNIGDGITSGTASSVLDCVASSNGGDGFVIGFGSTIQRCTARLNDDHGISASAFNFIFGNNCTQNGQSGAGAGIYVASGLSRVDSNHVTSNPTGYEVIASGCLFIRNTASGNATSFDLAAGNHYGPFVDTTLIVTFAISGDAAADTSGTTHPWANIVH